MNAPISQPSILPAADPYFLPAAEPSLAFAVDALTRRGALAESDGAGAIAILPEALARALELPEAVHLTGAPSADAEQVSCALGTPLLDRLMADVRARVPTSVQRVEEQTVRVSHARSLAERFTVRNAVVDVLDCTSGRGVYAVSFFNWVAEADERYEGVVSTVLGRDAALPEDQLLCLGHSVADAASSATLRPTHVEASAESLAELERRLVPLVEARVATSIAEASEGVRRRHQREHRRMADYFQAMVQETRSARRKVDRQTMLAKLSAIVADRDSKLAELVHRYTLRTRMAPLAVLWLDVPCAFVHLRVRRRKASRELTLRLPLGGHAFDQMPCAGCLGWTGSPAVCDDQLHLLCESCVPDARGRCKCLACR